MKQYKYEQYRPTFCSGFTNEQGVFSSLESLLQAPFLKVWREDPQLKEWRVCISEYCSEYVYLMAIMHDYTWWVVAFLEKGSNKVLKLPLGGEEYYHKLETQRKESLKRDGVKER